MSVDIFLQMFTDLRENFPADAADLHADNAENTNHLLFEKIDFKNCSKSATICGNNLRYLREDIDFGHREPQR